jgi:hypothetical protein
MKLADVALSELRGHCVLRVPRTGRRIVRQLGVDLLVDRDAASHEVDTRLPSILVRQPIQNKKQATGNFR